MMMMMMMMMMMTTMMNNEDHFSIRCVKSIAPEELLEAELELRQILLDQIEAYFKKNPSGEGSKARFLLPRVISGLKV